MNDAKESIMVKLRQPDPSRSRNTKHAVLRTSIGSIDSKNRSHACLYSRTLRTSHSYIQPRHMLPC
jgi:hypothetical protein